jgi:hypothetical protein
MNRSPVQHLIWLLLVLAIGHRFPNLAEGQERESSPPVVRMVIDYDDGVEKHFARIPWHEGMTVMDALDYARKHARGIQFRHRGAGATAFLTRIDDLENEGRGRNWIFHVNGEPGDRSFAISVLKPSDTVLWKFGAYR